MMRRIPIAFPGILAGLAWLLFGPGLAAATPPNDNFANRILVTGSLGQVQGNNVGASRESGEPSHAGNRASRSVWWRWAAPSAGIATLDTSGSTFDTILSIYTGTALASLHSVVENDGGALGSECVGIFPVVAGGEYQICVDGFLGATGTIVLNWRIDSPCPLPSAAGPPIPADGEGSAALSTELEWSSAGTVRAPKKIYGTDDRKDIYQVSDPGLVKLWESTVALVPRSSLRDNGDGTYSLPSTSLSVIEHICPSEPFAAQPAPAFCSGFLVAKDILATAGHCVVNSADCAATAFVFGFRMLDASTPVLTFPADQVYFCNGIIGSYHPDHLADWGLLRLDREVPDHDPLPIRRTGMIADGQNLFIIGHPLGLPAKYAGGAWVREDAAVEYFVTNLDAFGGNSGSAVFNADTRIVEGILVAGDPVDLVQNGNCLVSSTCSDTGCLGEEVTRAIQFAHLVPVDPRSLTYDFYFGACGDLVLQGETAEARWSMAGLLPGTTYCWKVVTKDGCGETEGPVWTFTTAPAVTPAAFLRGDAVPDGRIDISDPIAVLVHIFLSVEPLECQEAADVDNSGTVNLTDVIDLLGHLFLGGLSPASPYPGCGADPTPDDLGCKSYGACPASG